jgi:hypothetical protein
MLDATEVVCMCLDFNFRLGGNGSVEMEVALGECSSFDNDLIVSDTDLNDYHIVEYVCGSLVNCMHPSGMDYRQGGRCKRLQIPQMR